MAILNPVKRKCNVLMSGPIMELNGITGPVYGCQLTNEQIIRLVNNGKRVEEIDPTNSSRTRLLTIANCQKSVFGKEKSDTKVPVKEEVKREEEITNMSRKERKRLEWEERQKREKEVVNASQNNLTNEKESTVENDSQE